MRRHLVAISTVAALVIGVLSPVPSLAGPTASPGKSVGNGPCLTSGKANSQLQSTKNTNKACVAAPSFTLSNSSETRTVNTVATGFTITSTGGPIASFTISPSTPSGMSFNPTTGAFYGTPTVVAAATDYTITATNSAGSASKIFTFTVIDVIYNIGDIGPGGGKIFYYSATGFNCGSTFSAIGSPSAGKCHYLEVAPSIWFNNVSDPQFPWAIGSFVNTSVPGATETAIGGGFKNSSIIVPTIGGPYESYAAGIARGYRDTSGDEWYLPSIDELNQMCKWARGQALVSDATVCDSTGAINSGINAEGFGSYYYWSSSEAGASVALVQSFETGSMATGSKDQRVAVRPIRAF